MYSKSWLEIHLDKNKLFTQLIMNLTRIHPIYVLIMKMQLDFQKELVKRQEKINYRLMKNF